MSATTSTDPSPGPEPGVARRGRWWLTALIVALAAPWTAWCAVRLLGVEAGYPMIPALAFTPYAAATSIVPLAFALLLRRWKTALLAAVVLGCLAACVVPRAVPDMGQDTGHEGPRLRVMTFNMLFGQADPDEIVRLVRKEKVDVLSLQEYTFQSADALSAAGLNHVLGHRVAEPYSGASGGAVYSRFPLREVKRPRGPYHAMIGAEVAAPGARPVEVLGVHTSAPLAASLIGMWRETVSGVPSADPDGVPRIAAGDFNATLDHAVMRELLATGYRDAAATVGDGWRATWPVDGRLPGVTIDHVLVDERIAVTGTERFEVSGSDHRAVIADIRLPKS